MSKATLTWTMHLKTNKQRFEDAFYKLIKYENHLLSLESSVYYRGKVNSGSSFFLEKKIDEAIMVLRFDRLDGKIIEDGNGLLLTLTLHPCITPFAYYTKAAIFSMVLCIGSTPFLYDILGAFFLLFIGVIFLPVFFGVLWLMKRIRRVTDLGLKARFDNLLLDIQKETERGGHIPVY
jgi:hypothetical protein